MEEDLKKLTQEAIRNAYATTIHQLFNVMNVASDEYRSEAVKNMKEGLRLAVDTYKKSMEISNDFFG